MRQPYETITAAILIQRLQALDVSKGEAIGTFTNDVLIPYFAQINEQLNGTYVDADEDLSHYYVVLDLWDALSSEALRISFSDKLNKVILARTTPLPVASMKALAKIISLISSVAKIRDLETQKDGNEDFITYLVTTLLPILKNNKESSKSQLVRDIFSTPARAEDFARTKREIEGDKKSFYSCLDFKAFASLYKIFPKEKVNAAPKPEDVSTEEKNMVNLGPYFNLFKPHSERVENPAPVFVDLTAYCKLFQPRPNSNDALKVVPREKVNTASKPIQQMHFDISSILDDPGMEELSQKNCKRIGLKLLACISSKDPKMTASIKIKAYNALSNSRVYDQLNENLKSPRIMKISRRINWLYDERVALLITFVERLLGRLENKSHEFIVLNEKLGQFISRQDCIQEYADIFLDVAKGDKSERELIDTLLDVGNSVSLRKLILNAEGAVSQEELLEESEEDNTAPTLNNFLEQFETRTQREIERARRSRNPYLHLDFTNFTNRRSGRRTVPEEPASSGTPTTQLEGGVNFTG